MFFFFKEKPIVVDCFTNREDIHDLFPIQPTIKCIPEWWKETPKYFKPFHHNNGWVPTNSYEEAGVATIKKCFGVTELFKLGFVISAWESFFTKTNANGSWTMQTATEAEIATDHPAFQLGSAWENQIHMKLLSPWFIKEKSGVTFTFVHPMWMVPSLASSYSLTPGVTDFKYQHSSNLNLFLPRVDAEIKIHAGTPLAQVIPNSDRKVQIKNHLVSELEYIKIARSKEMGRNFVPPSYSRHVKAIKAAEERNKKGCPFFGWAKE